ncbi:MAG: hypothetical protein GF310_12200, partial [candidate division Zixibacteria bacterium]|nr:hypothetical protein [candidate division Zixibacteria bacterium]
MQTLIRIIILAISAVYIVSWLYPAYWNWSVMPLDVLYPINIIFLAFAILFTIIPRLSAIIWEVKSRVWQALMMKMAAFPKALKAALWIIIPAAFFYLIRSHSYILGDGNLILGNIVDGIPISSTAFGYSQLIGLLAELFAIETNAQAANLMAALSIICGVIYTYSLYKILCLLIDDYRVRLWLFLIIFFSGISIIFSGYVETYPILLAWLAIYLHSVIESLKYKSAILIPAGILAVGLFWHVWFLAFVPSLIWLINQRYNLLPRIFIFLFSAIYIIAIYIGGTFTARSGIQTTLPLIPNDSTNYFLFSPVHFADIINILFIAGPVVGFMALAYLFIPSVYRQSENLRFFLWAAVPAFLISFMIDPVLGAPRDWDLLSIFALPA